MFINPDLADVQALEAHKAHLHQYSFETTLNDFKQYVLEYAIAAYNAQLRVDSIMSEYSITAIEARAGYDVAFMLTRGDVRIRMDFVAKVYVEVLEIEPFLPIKVPTELASTVVEYYSTTGIIGKNLFTNSLSYVRHHYDVPADPFPITYKVHSIQELITYTFSPNGGVFNADLTNVNSFTVAINTTNVPDGTVLHYAFSYIIPLDTSVTVDPFGTTRTGTIGKVATNGNVTVNSNLATITLPYIGNLAVFPAPTNLGYSHDSAFRIELSKAGIPVQLSAVNNIHILPPGDSFYFSIDSAIIDRRINNFITNFNVVPAMENGTDLYTWTINHIDTINADFRGVGGITGTSGVVTNNRSFPIILNYTNNAADDVTFTITVSRNGIPLLTTGVMTLHNPDYNPVIIIPYEFVTNSSVRPIDVGSITPAYTQHLKTRNIPSGTVVDYVIDYVYPLEKLYPVPEPYGYGIQTNSKDPLQKYVVSLLNLTEPIFNNIPSFDIIQDSVTSNYWNGNTSPAIDTPVAIIGQPAITRFGNRVIVNRIYTPFTNNTNLDLYSEVLYYGVESLYLEAGPIIFTIELSVFLLSNTTDFFVAGDTGSNLTTLRSWSIWMHNGVPYLKLTASGIDYLVGWAEPDTNGFVTLPLHTWSDITITCVAGATVIRVNGVVTGTIASDFMSGVARDNNARLVIHPDSTNQILCGPFRITKGETRTVTPETRPTAPFPFDDIIAVIKGTAIPLTNSIVWGPGISVLGPDYTNTHPISLVTGVIYNPGTGYITVGSAPYLPKFGLGNFTIEFKVYLDVMGAPTSGGPLGPVNLVSFGINGGLLRLLVDNYGMITVSGLGVVGSSITANVAFTMSLAVEYKFVFQRKHGVINVLINDIIAITVGDATDIPSGDIIFGQGPFGHLNGYYKDIRIATAYLYDDNGFTILPEFTSSYDPFGVPIAALTGPVGPSGTLVITNNTADLTLPFMVDPSVPSRVNYRSNFGFKVDLSIAGTPVGHSGGIAYSTGMVETNDSYFDINNAIINRAIHGFKVVFHSKVALSLDTHAYRWDLDYRNGLNNADLIGTGWTGMLTSTDGWTIEIPIPYANVVKEDCQYRIVISANLDNAVLGKSGWYTLHSPDFVPTIPLPGIFYIPTIKYNFDDPSLLVHAQQAYSDVSPWNRSTGTMPNFLTWPITPTTIMPAATAATYSADVYIADIIPTTGDTYAVLKSATNQYLLYTCNWIIGGQNTLSSTPCDYIHWVAPDISIYAPFTFLSSYSPGCYLIEPHAVVGGARDINNQPTYNSVITRYGFANNDGVNNSNNYTFKYAVMDTCNSTNPYPNGSIIPPLTSEAVPAANTYGIPGSSDGSTPTSMFTFGAETLGAITPKVIDSPSIYTLKHPNITVGEVSMPASYNIMHFSHAHIACHNVVANVWIPVEYRDPVTNAVLPTFYNSELNPLLRPPNEPSGYEVDEYMSGIINSNAFLNPYDYVEQIVGGRRFNFTTYVAGIGSNPTEIDALMTANSLDRCVHGFGVFPVGLLDVPFHSPTIQATKYNYVNVVMYIDTTDVAAPYGKLVVLIKTIDPFELMGQTFDQTHVVDTYKCLTSLTTGYVYNSETLKLELFAMFKWCNQMFGTIDNILMRLVNPITAFGVNGSYEIYKTDLPKAMPTPIKLANGNRILMNLQPSNGAVETAGASAHVKTNWSYINGAMSYIPSELSPDNQMSLTVAYRYPMADWNIIKTNFASMPNINGNICKIPLNTAMANPIGSDWNTLANIYATVTGIAPNV